MSSIPPYFGTAAVMAARNPLVPKGITAGETDTGVIKVGDGATRYSSLSVALIGTYAQPNLNTVVIWGDSYTSKCFVTSGTDAYNSCQGYWAWANVIAGQRAKLLYNAGVSGQVTSQILARFSADVAAYAPGWVVIEGGTNDVSSSIDAVTIKANLSAMVTAARGIGARVILFTIPPRNSISSAQRTVQVEVNRWIRAQAQTLRGVYLVDAWQVLVDTSTLGIQSALSNDGIHPNSVGAARLGRLVAAHLTGFVPSTDLLGFSTEDSLFLTTNPYMTGTSGTAGTGVTGNVAAGWAVASETGSAITATVSKVARTDGLPGEWQQVSLASGTGVVLSINQDGVNTAWTPGTTQVYALCEFQTDSDLASVTKFHLGINAINTGFTGQGSVEDLQWIAGDTWASESRLTSGVMLTPTLVVPAGANKRLITQFVFRGTGTFRVGRCGLYKVA